MVEIGRLARDLQRAAESGQPAPSANTAVNSMAWLTPSAPTISRSCVAARTSRPKRVRVSSSQMQRQQHQRADDDQKQVVARQLAAEHLRSAPRRPGARGPSRSSGPQSQSVASLMTSTSAKVASSWNSSGAR